ncbi:MAG: hypothetical protein ACRYHA_34810 [Janthinobacterium lividum]
MQTISSVSEISIFQRALESLNSLLKPRKETPQARMIKDAWNKGLNDAVIDKKQNPYPKGSERFHSYEDGHKSQWWLNN